MRARLRALAQAKGRRRRTVAIAALSALALAAAVWWTLTGPLMAIHGVSLDGYKRPDRAMLQKALETVASQRGSVVSPPVADLREAASHFPWVDAIVIHRTWPRALTIEVITERPAALVVATGGTVLVNDAGRVLGRAPTGARLARVRLAGPAPAVGETLPEKARAALAFAVASPPAVARRLRALEVGADGRLTGSLASGPPLVLGRPTQLAAKAQALALVLAKLTPAEEAQATYIDLTVPTRPAAGGLEAIDPNADATALSDPTATTGETDAGDQTATPDQSTQQAPADPATSDPADQAPAAPPAEPQTQDSGAQDDAGTPAGPTSDASALQPQPGAAQPPAPDAGTTP